MISATILFHIKRISLSSPLYIIHRYYGVSPLMVEWTTTLCPIFYVAFVSPISYLVNKYDLRWVLIVSSGLSWLGAFMKTFSVHPNRFYLIVIGKSIAAIAQVNFFSCYSLLFIIPLYSLCHMFFDSNYTLS